MTRVALIGYGVWGRNILRDLRALGYEVVVVESIEQNRVEARRNGAIGVYPEISALPPVQGIVVATPASTHADIVELVLARDVPILVEKPFTTDSASARRIVERAGDRVFVGHTWCYHSGIAELARIAKSEELGPVLGLKTVRANWTSSRRDVDTTWNLLPHDLSITQHVLGEIPRPHSAVAEVMEHRCVGLSAVLGQAPWVAVDVSNRSREKRREVRLHCRDGVAVMSDPDSGQIEILRGSESAPVVERRAYAGPSALQRELELFTLHCGGGPALPTTARQGLEVVEAIESLRQLAGLETRQAPSYP